MINKLNRRKSGVRFCRFSADSGKIFHEDRLTVREAILKVPEEQKSGPNPVLLS